MSNMRMTTLALAAALVLGQFPAPNAPALLSTPQAAAVAALIDLQSLPDSAKPFQRYLWAPPEISAQQAYAATSVLANSVVSRSNVDIHPADPVMFGGQILRLDLRVVAPDEKDFKQIFDLWESLAANEPYFHLPQGEAKLVDSLPWVHRSGEIYNQRWQRVVIVAPALGKHIPLEIAALHEQTASQLPIVHLGWFISLACTAADGGRYYDFIGLNANTSQEDYLLSRGASEKQVAALKSDERAVVFRSGVTGKPRRIDVFRGAGVRPSVGTGLIAITHDPKDEDVEAVADPIRNLLTFKDSGREIILERANGWHEFTIWNGQGKLAATVPDNIAANHEIPAPHTKRLQPAIGCFQCHGMDEGWKPFRNDVQAILGRNFSDVFDDISSRDSVPETLKKLAGLYSGNLAEPMRLGRNSYSDAVFRVTKQSVPEAVKSLTEVYGEYVYEMVSPAGACRLLGIEANDTTAAERFNKVILPLDIGPDGISRDDPAILILRAGMSVNRKDFERIFQDLMLRAIK